MDVIGARSFLSVFRFFYLPLLHIAMISIKIPFSGPIHHPTPTSTYPHEDNFI